MKVAVTGGIGAGKSEFMRAVKELGIRTYSADEINAELLRDKRYIEKLSAAFPLAVKTGKSIRLLFAKKCFQTRRNAKRSTRSRTPKYGGKSKKSRATPSLKCRFCLKAE